MVLLFGLVEYLGVDFVRNMRCLCVAVHSKDIRGVDLSSMGMWGYSYLLSLVQSHAAFAEVRSLIHFRSNISNPNNSHISYWLSFMNLESVIEHRERERGRVIAVPELKFKIYAN